ncbi:unnamed protein product [Pleuronectes platessa]|uniref:Uncharacterized protein n=1 Tax=Pleuronectes platessa TaxID=8262 RepID=A0A9N7TKG9_PLEPL|nr:unnamed protein product [Pleuronectes platessa]
METDNQLEALLDEYYNITMCLQRLEPHVHRRNDCAFAEEKLKPPPTPRFTTMTLRTDHRVAPPALGSREISTQGQTNGTDRPMLISFIGQYADEGVEPNGYPSPQRPPANPARPNLMHLCPHTPSVLFQKTERDGALLTKVADRRVEINSMEPPDESKEEKEQGEDRDTA